jgi:hypothetical protein
MKQPLRSAHALIWSVLGVGLPLALLAILTMRQTVPADRPAIQLAPPGQEASQ